MRLVALPVELPAPGAGPDSNRQPTIQRSNPILTASKDISAEKAGQEYEFRITPVIRRDSNPLPLRLYRSALPYELRSNPDLTTAKKWSPVEVTLPRLLGLGQACFYYTNGRFENGSRAWLRPTIS